MPQNLIGLGLLTWFKLKRQVVAKERFRDSNVYQIEAPKLGGAVSLGKYIFIFSYYGRVRPNIIKHEYGHSIQSKILGPLYLLLGLCSIVWAGFFDGYRRKNKVSYYWFFTEKWANNLMGLTEKDL